MLEESLFQQLHYLKSVLDAGFISPEEFYQRRQQIVDRLTGTTNSASSSTISTLGNDSSASSSAREELKKLCIRVDEQRKEVSAWSRVSGDFEIQYNDEDLLLHEASKCEIAENCYTGNDVVFHKPPDFSEIVAERAIKHVFSLEKRCWTRKRCMVKIDEVPFAKGGLRLVYHLLDLDDNVNMVAKISMDPKDNLNKKVYFQDVEIQEYAKVYAKKFNSYEPPKNVDFVKAFILELVDRKGKPICGVERYIDGPYRKHNNNFGYVSLEERNTPQAFSHFTYESSQHSLLICDIQGVGDLYTDPQIHSISTSRLGKGDLGLKGIEKFLETHQCNPICRYLKLPIINASEMNFEQGTRPAQMFMKSEGIQQDRFSFTFSNLPSLIDHESPLLNYASGDSPTRYDEPVKKISSYFAFLKNFVID